MSHDTEAFPLPFPRESMRGRSRWLRALVTAYRVVRADPQRMSPEWYAGVGFGLLVNDTQGRRFAGR